MAAHLSDLSDGLENVDLGQGRVEINSCAALPGARARARTHARKATARKRTGSTVHAQLLLGNTPGAQWAVRSHIV